MGREDFLRIAAALDELLQSPDDGLTPARVRLIPTSMAPEISYTLSSQWMDAAKAGSAQVRDSARQVMSRFLMVLVPEGLDLGPLRSARTGDGELRFFAHPAFRGLEISGVGVEFRLNPASGRATLSLSDVRWTPPSEEMSQLAESLATLDPEAIGGIAAAAAETFANDEPPEDAVALEHLRPRAVWMVENGILVPRIVATFRGNVLYIDPDTGRLLRTRSLASEIDGTGRVYAANELETPQTSMATLPNLNSPGTALDGSGLKVCGDNSDSLCVDYPSTTGTVFDYPPESLGFGATMAYYHSSRAREHVNLSEYGAFNIGDMWSGKLTWELPEPVAGEPREVSSHSGLNASYTPSPDRAGRRLAANSLFSGYSFAEDGDVVLHEMGHWIFNELETGPGGGGLGTLAWLSRHVVFDNNHELFRAVNEGFADAFAQVVAGDFRFAPAYSWRNEHGDDPAWNPYSLYAWEDQNTHTDWRSYVTGWRFPLQVEACASVPGNPARILNSFREPEAERWEGTTYVCSSTGSILSGRHVALEAFSGSEGDSDCWQHGLEFVGDDEIDSPRCRYEVGSLWSHIILDLQKWPAKFPSARHALAVAMDVIKDLPVLIPVEGLEETLWEKMRASAEDMVANCNCGEFLDDVFLKRNWKFKKWDWQKNPVLSSATIAGIPALGMLNSTRSYDLPVLQSTQAQSMGVIASTAAFTVSLAATDNDVVQGVTYQLRRQATGSTPPHDPSLVLIPETQGTSFTIPSSATCQPAQACVGTEAKILVLRVRDRAGNKTSYSILLEYADPSPTADLAVSRTSIDLFGDANQVSYVESTFAVSNVGGTPMPWTAAGAGAGVTVTPASGSLAAGQSQTVTVRAQSSVGQATRTLTVQGAGESINVTLSIRILPQGAPGTVTIYPSEDTFVSELSPNNSYGNLTTMTIRGGTGQRAIGLFRFPQGDIDQGVWDARLRLYKTAATGATYRTYLKNVTEAWSETSTWNSLGGSISTGYYSQQLSVGTGSGWLEWDVTNFVNNWGPHPTDSVLIEPYDSGTNVTFGSSESGTQPRLVVTPLRDGCDLIGTLDVNPAGADRNGNGVPEFYVGASVTVTLPYRNIGVGDCGIVSHELARETAAGGSSFQLTEPSTEILGPNESSESVGDIDFNTSALSVAPGSYRYRHTVDSNGEVNEPGGEGNNNSFYYFEVVNAPAFGFAPSAPILSVQERDWGSQVVQVSNTSASTPPLVWTATPTVGWISLSETNGTSAYGVPKNITIFANAAGLAPGTYSGTINFISTAGINGSLSVSMQVTPAPGQLEVSRIEGGEPGSGGIESEIRKGETPTVVRYQVENGGTSPITWTAAASSTIPGLVLSASPSSGATPATVVVSANATAVTNIREGEVTITISCATGCVETFEDHFSVRVLGYRMLIDEVVVGALDGVELKNETPVSVDVGGWVLRTTATSHVSHTLASVSVPAGGFLRVLEGPGTNTGSTIYTGSAFGWTVGGAAAAALSDEEGFGADFVRWRASTTQPPAGTDWYGPAVPHRPEESTSLSRRLGLEDSDTANEWCPAFPSPLTASQCRDIFLDGFESGDDSAWAGEPPPSPVAGLVGYWPFDSDYLDHSGNGNHGSWSAGGQLDPGRFGSAPSFIQGEHFTVPNSQILRDMAALTVAAWLRPTADPHPDGIEDLFGGGGDGSESRYALAIVPPNGVSFIGYNTDMTPAQMPAAYPIPSFLNQWHHLAVTWDGASVRVYAEGQLVQVGSFAGTVSVPTTSPFYMNRHDWGGSGASSRLTGLLDDVAVFSRALSATEVLELASDTNGNGVADFWDGVTLP